MANIIMALSALFIFIGGIGVGLMIADFYNTLTEVNDK